jgi:hypothetical protein
MPSDIRAQQAREFHRRLQESEARSADLRAQRNRLIRELRAEDPEQWTYSALAAAVGCKRETVAAVLQGRTA